MNAKCMSLAPSTLGLTGLLIAQLISAAPLPNAWQITDNSSEAGSLLNYTTNLSLLQQTAATARGWRLAASSRFLTDFGDTKTMAVGYGMANRRFLVWFELDASGDLTVELEGGDTYTVTTNGSGTWLYHTHEIVYDPLNARASYIFDGEIKTADWSGSANALPAGQVFWGAGSSAGRARMNFQSIGFEITNTVVAAFDAGAAGNPATAPNPANLGWRRTPSTFAPGTSVSGISPDTTLLPAVFTRAPAQYTFDTVEPRAEGFASGSAAVGWFDWGTTTNYGNSTTFQPLGSGTNRINFSNIITGLVIGTNYYYRAVVSNAFGTALGFGVSFNLEYFKPSATTFAADVQHFAGVEMTGKINPTAPTTDAWFEFGTGGSYGMRTAAWQLESADGADIPLATVVKGLAHGTYDFRMVASNVWGMAWGSNRTFTVRPFEHMTRVVLPGVEGSQIGWADFNRDGRMDILLTGYAPAQYQPLWMNTQSGFTGAAIPGWPQQALGSFGPGVYTDQHVDFLFAGANQITNYCRMFRNTGTSFTSATISGMPPARGSSIAAGDYDNDGRLDIFITGRTNRYLTLPEPLTGTSQLWRNTGSGFTRVTIPGLPQLSYGAVAWGDYDNDGRLDFLITGATNLPVDYPVGGLSQLWRNTGSGFTNVPVPGLPGVYRSSVAWGDYDNDGWLDFVIAGTTDYDSQGAITPQVWRNTGSGFINLPIAGLPKVFGSPVIWGDFDHDGRLDFFIGGHSQFWRNTGTGFTNVTSAVAPDIPQPAFGVATLGDYDDDSRLDLLFAGYSSAHNGRITQLWRNHLPGTNAPPSVPTGLRAAVTNGIATLTWNASTDDHTPAPGLTYNVRIGTRPGWTDIMAPAALTDGTRLLAAMGNTQLGTNFVLNGRRNLTLYWSVQAIDTSFAGSAFAAEGQFNTIIGDTVPRPVISNFRLLSNGQFQFSFMNQTTTDYEVIATTEPSLPLDAWDILGLPVSLGNGLYRFEDSDAPANPQRFYGLRSQ